MNLYNGKGDRPRNLSKKFKENYSKISWGSSKKPTKTKFSKKVYVYGATLKD